MGPNKQFRMNLTKPLGTRALCQHHRGIADHLSLLLALCIGAASPQINAASPLFTEISTIDHVPQYRYLDWVSPEELATKSNTLHLSAPRCCEGIYLPPIIPSSITDPQLAPIQISAERYEADVNGKVNFDGNVVIQQAGRQLESDHVELDQITKATALQGNVKIRQDGMLLIGETATFDLNAKSLDIHKAEYVIHKQHIHGQASRIYNPNPHTLALDSGTYTTCEPNSDAWLFRADDITLDNQSGWGTAKNATLEIQDVPIFYFPWVMFPVDDRRQTGLLFPSIGEDEDNGTDIAIPLYLNLAANMDATVTFRNLSKRGSLIDGEFRYLSQLGEGQLGASYLPDDTQTDSDRQLTLFKHVGTNNRGWSANVDYTRVSDIDYFSDLDTTLNASSQTHLDQKAELLYQQRHWKSSILVQEYQTLDDLLSDASLPYRKLPQIRVEGNKDTLLGSAEHQIGIDWITEFTHFEHPEESSLGITDAQRTHLSPSINYHFTPTWGYIKPTLQGYYSYYDLNGNSDTFDSSIDKTSQERQTYAASVDTGLFFDRDITLNNQSFTQTLEPRLYYLYSPEVNQDDIPTFDTSELSFGYSQMFRNNRFSGADRVGDARQLSLGLTTRFLDNSDGSERLRASIGQIYYFKDRNIQTSSATEPDTDSQSAIIGQLALPLNDALTLYSEIQWDDQRNHIDQTDVQLSYHNENHQIFNAGYQQQGNGAEGSDFENELEQLDLSTAWTLNQHWSIASRWIYDIKKERTFEGLFGVEYDSCCWSVQLVHRRYLEERGDDTTDRDGDLEMTTRKGTYLQFQFKGLGGVGNALESILDDAILGYERRRKALESQFK